MLKDLQLSELQMKTKLNNTKISDIKRNIIVLAED